MKFATIRFNDSASNSYLRPLTHLRLVWLTILGQLDELFGEHAATVTEDVTFQFDIGTWAHELNHDGVSSGVDPNLHVLTTH